MRRLQLFEHEDGLWGPEPLRELLRELVDLENESTGLADALAAPLGA